MEIGLLYLQDKPLETIPAQRLRSLLAEAHLQGSNLCVLLHFSINYCSQTIDAYCWCKEVEKWQLERIAIPETIIFQGTMKTDADRKLREWCLRNRLTVSDVGVNKHNLANIITASPFNDLIIPTHTLTQENAINEIKCWVEKWQGAVIKRQSSNRGIGLIFIRKENNHWILHSERKKLQGHLNEIVEQAYKLIKRRLSYRGYIIQPFIKAKTKDERPVDIRAHLQKRRDGKWHCTRAYVRVAEASSMLPNYSKGGYQGDLSSFLQLVNPDNYEAVSDKLIETAIGIADVQDNISELPLSELGLDFLFDEHNKLWLIETNTWPQTALHEMERARYVIEYLRFLQNANQ